MRRATNLTCQTGILFSVRTEHSSRTRMNYQRQHDIVSTMYTLSVGTSIYNKSIYQLYFHKLGVNTYILPVNPCWTVLCDDVE